MATEILGLEALRVCFQTEPNAPVVDGVSFTVAEGERLGLVGESGSGKSLTLLAALGVTPENGRVTGTVRVAGQSLAERTAEERRLLRGRLIGWVPQEPAASLNPTWRIGFQLAELVRAHRGLGRRAARPAAAALLDEVGLEPARFAAAWAHQLSGGEAQRIALALALAGEPRLLLADEPTTALDVLTQAEILELLEHIRRARDMALVLVSHDLEVVASVADRLIVLYAGRVVEEGPAVSLLADPWHPYTRELVAAAQLEGAPSAAASAPSATHGCRFAPRCPVARVDCSQAEPALAPAGAGRSLRCPVVGEQHRAGSDA